MTTPATRDEVVETGAEAIYEAVRNPAVDERWPLLWESQRKPWRSAYEQHLTALKAAGVRLVPAEATDEMMRATDEPMKPVDNLLILASAHGGRLRYADGQSPVANAYRAAVAASPYNKETEANG